MSSHDYALLVAILWAGGIGVWLWFERQEALQIVIGRWILRVVRSLTRAR